MQESFNINIPIVSSGIEPIMQGLFADNAEAEEFDNTFSASIGETLFIPAKEIGFQNLLALNIQRGRDHGLWSYTEYRQDVCGISDAWVGPRSINPFNIFSNTITNRETRRKLQTAYGSPDNHIDLFAAAISEDTMMTSYLVVPFGAFWQKSLKPCVKVIDCIMKMATWLPFHNKRKLRGWPWQK